MQITSTSVLVSLMRSQGYDFLPDRFNPHEASGGKVDFDGRLFGDQLDKYKPTMERLPAGSDELFIARRNFVDDLLWAWRRKNSANYYFRQVVMLGSGMDPLAGRMQYAYETRPDLYPPPPRFIEIDVQEVIDAKRARIDAYNEAVDAQRSDEGDIRANYNDDHVEYMAADFSREGALQRLINEHQIDLTIPTLFVGMGLTYYLSDEAVRELLHDVARWCWSADTDGNLSAVAFDYAPSLQGESSKDARAAVEELNATFKFSCLDITPLCLDYGLNYVSDVSFFNWCTQHASYQALKQLVRPNDQRNLRFVVAHRGSRAWFDDLRLWPINVREAKNSLLFVG